MALQSQLLRGDPKLEAAAVSAQAHIVPGARGEHVRKIQRALNQLDDAGLTIDGVYGNDTAQAVLAYKDEREIVNFTYQTQADNIVGVMTMAALDAELAGSEDDAGAVPTVALQLSGSCQGHAPVQAAKGKGKAVASDVKPANPLAVAAAIALVAKVRHVIKATRFRLTTAGPFVESNRKLTMPTGLFLAPVRQTIHILINVFSMDKLQNPRPAFDNMVRVFANMDVAFNRSFETDPLIAAPLFVANTRLSQEKNTLAYTAAGGAFLSPKVKLAGLGVPANQIYICDLLLKEIELQQISVLIHELAHFVSGRPIRIDHSNGVPAAGLMIKDRGPFDRIRPEAKLRSAEHFAFFAMVAGFSKLKSL